MIFGLHGKMGAGKNEAARRLALLSPLPVVEVSYARKLKESVAALFNISLDEIEEWKNNDAVSVLIETSLYNLAREFSFRSFLQRYGTEAHREVFGQDFWLDAALPLEKQYSDALYVVTDVRFPNEAERIFTLGGWTVKIVGPDENTGDHASEQELDNCEWLILNNVRDDDFASLDGQLKTLLEVAGVSAD